MNKKPKNSKNTAKPHRPTASELQEVNLQQEQRPMLAELYHRAEDQLRERQQKPQSEAGTSATGSDPQRLLHELEVHQIELELQNAELRQTRDELEAALANYTDLYDFAPAGYFTLARPMAPSARSISPEPTSLALSVHFCWAGLLDNSLPQRSVRPLIRSSDRSLPVRTTRPLILGCRAKADRSSLSESEPNARPTGLDCRVVLVDITGLKKEEDKVRVSEIRYRRLFETAHDGVLLLDPGTRKITDANPFMTKLLGYPKDQLVGKELFEIGLLKDEAASQEMFEKLKKKHEVRYEDLPLEAKDGRHQEVEVVANLYSENGHAVIQCNIRDITERKLAEAVLRRSEALFSTLIEQAPVGVYVVDSQLRLRQVNPKAQPVFENAQPVIGQDFSKIIRRIWPRKTAAEILSRFRYALQTGEPFYSSAFSERRRDTGLVEFYEWQLQCIALPNGEQGVVCFFNNLTERKKAEERAASPGGDDRLEPEVGSGDCPAAGGGAIA